MKKSTCKHLKYFQKLLLKKAYFDEDRHILFFTYPKGGWMNKTPVIDGVPLEYVGEHDDGELPLNKIIDYNNIKEWKYCPSGKPIFGFMSKF